MPLVPPASCCHLPRRLLPVPSLPCSALWLRPASRPFCGNGHLACPNRADAKDDRACDDLWFAPLGWQREGSRVWMPSRPTLTGALRFLFPDNQCVAARRSHSQLAGLSADHLHSSAQSVGESLTSIRGLNFHRVLKRLALLSYTKAKCLSYRDQVLEFELERDHVSLHMIQAAISAWVA